MLDSKTSKYFDAQVLKIAHRGFYKNDPENSMAAFWAARTHHFDGVEFDVHLSADGVPVVFHDDDLWRVCSRKDRIVDLSANELCALSLFESTQKIPKLEQMLSDLPEDFFLYLEIKIPEYYWTNSLKIQKQVQKILDVVRSIRPNFYGWIGSFNVLAVQEIHAQGFKNKSLVICETPSELKSAFEHWNNDILYSISYKNCHEVLRSISIQNVIYWDLPAEVRFMEGETIMVKALVLDSFED